MVRLVVFALLITYASTAFRSASSPTAGGIVGDWKRTSLTIVDAKGKTTDVMETMSRSIPCAKEIIYTFAGDGEVTSKIPESCGPMRQVLENSNTTGRWSMSGDKVTVTPTKKELPVATYDVTYQGDTMTWVFTFTDNPKVPNPTKAQKMTTVYKRA